jgi:MoaA/NifB/PqqE/SkfB family radical SAM enzyme
MMSITGINFKHINLDISNKCALACPKCDRNTMTDFLSPTSELSLENFEKIAKFFPNIDLCGQISDPLYHSNLPGIIDICIKYGNTLSIHTGGHGRTDKWWKEVFEKSLKLERVHWIFALDGIPENAHLHKINQDGIKVFERMKMGSDILGKTSKHRVIWRYIIFKFNENNIDEAQDLAEEFNMEFQLIKSNKWSGLNDPLLPTDPNNYIRLFK